MGGALTDFLRQGAEEFARTADDAELRWERTGRTVPGHLGSVSATGEMQPGGYDPGDTAGFLAPARVFGESCPEVGEEVSARFEGGPWERFQVTDVKRGPATVMLSLEAYDHRGGI